VQYWCSVVVWAEVSTSDEFADRECPSLTVGETLLNFSARFVP